MDQNIARRQPGLGEAMLRKLLLRSSFTGEERDALLALPVHETRFMARDTIVYEGDATTRSCLLLDGCAARSKLLDDGKRQIVALHIAGDIMDLHTALVEVADDNIIALGNVRVAYLPHDAVLAAASRYPGIARAFWLDTLVDGAVAREWVLNVGQRAAYARVAHLFCEMMVRSDAIGLTRGQTFPFPVSQGELGSATGLTPVHINRMMKRLRADGLISTRGTDLCIEDWTGLCLAGGFDPAYLHFPN